MNHRLTLLIILVGLTLPLAPRAFAHDARPVIISRGYSVVYPRGVELRWLHAQPTFDQWYRASRHRYVHHRLSWPALHALYRVEVRHSRPVRHYHRRGCEHDRFHYRGRKHRQH